MAAAAMALVVSGSTWPTPEQVRDVLRDEPGLGSFLGDVWAEPFGRAGLLALAVGLVAVGIHLRDLKEHGWVEKVGVAGLAAVLAGLVTVAGVGFAGPRDHTAQLQDEFRAGQVQAASLLAGPLDQERQGWVVAVPDDEGHGPRITVSDLNEGPSSLLVGRGPVVVRFTALDETGAQHACTYTPVEVEENPAIGPDGPTSVAKPGVGGLDCETREGQS